MNQPLPPYYCLIIILLVLVNGCHCKNYDTGQPEGSSIHKSGKPVKKHVPPLDITKIVESPPVKNTGLPSGNNLCYSNSTVQMLASFYRELIAQKALDPNNKIAVAGNELVKDMIIPQETPNFTKLKTQSKEFFKNLQESEANGGIAWVGKCGTQEDAHELLTKILDRFNLPMARLQYKLVNSITQQESLIENTKFPGGEPFNKLELPLSIDASQTMQDIVNSFCSPETIDDYKWDGQPTKVQKVPILRELDKLYNKMLIVTLKRYGYDAITEKAFKIDKPIGQPFHITLTQEQNPGNQQDISYELAGFIKHNGGTGGGHYVAYVKVDGTWIEYNDSSVQQIPETKAKEEARGGYAFFYQQSMISQG